MDVIAVGQRWEPIDPWGSHPVIIEDVDGDRLHVREVSTARLRIPMFAYQLRRDYRRDTNPQHN